MARTIICFWCDMANSNGPRIDGLVSINDKVLADLSSLLRECVEDGASIGFIWPFGEADAQAYWREQVAPAVMTGDLLLRIMRCDGVLAGTAQLFLGTPGNQPHRAEVRKVLVRPSYRRRGLARRLMADIEAEARRHQRSLLTLDTRTGDHAEPLYRDCGFQTAGRIPGYCLDPAGQHLDATTIMYKPLA